MVTEKFTLDGYYVILCDILSKPTIVKAESMDEAKEIFNEYWYWDIDYMDTRMEHIYGVKKADIGDISQYIGDGYLVKEEE